jgi:ankyrin repeat protein
MSALPRKISEYYDEAVKRIDCEYDGDRHLAWKALSYVFCAKRPLNVLELRHALAVEDGDTSLDEEALPILEILLNVTIGLLRVDESQIIGLVHHTLQEYLEKHSESLVAHADLEIAKISLTYLSFDVFKQGPCKSGDELRQRLKRHCFLDYAAHHWGHHLVKNQHHPSVVNLLSTFLEEKEKLASFVQILYLRPRWKPGWYDCYPRNFDTLHVMAYWGLDELLTLIFREEMGVNNRDSYGATALQQGAEHGHKSVVQFLLSMGAEVNTSNERGETPLYWAARNGHKTIVELLISCRATALTKDIEGWTALDWAAAGGNSDLLKTLLKYGADVVEDDGKVKALLLATGAGHELTVQTLLESGAEINARDSEGSTALDWAVPSGNENMVRLLLCNGANVKSKDEYGNTAMHWATPYMALVRLLLEYGAEVDARNDKRQTALCWAAQDGPVEVAELLLENKANIDAQDVYGFTALHRAALRGRKGMVRLLLEKGADPNIMDKDRWTPLHVAASKRYDDLAELLRNYVENGEEILHLVRLQQQDSRKQALLEQAAEEKGEASTVLTGLRAAIQERQFGRSQLLLDRGADVDGKEVGGFTALILAASVGDLQAMQLLLENGADIDLGGYDERTPLHWASERGETASVKLLVERGANVDARTFQWTAVLLAARKARDEIVTFLIQSGADVNVEDYHGRTALHWVVMYGGRATARLLADKGANINATDRWGKTALMWAIEKNRIKTVRVLLDTGADVEVKARYSVTALHLAAFLGYESIVRCLLERGANVNAVALWRKAEHDADTESDATSTPIEYLNEMLYQWRLEKDDLDQDEVNEETRFGFTAGQLATRCEHFAIQRLLEH